MPADDQRSGKEYILMEFFLKKKILINLNFIHVKIFRETATIN
jgi:hypothetical protein